MDQELINGTVLLALALCLLGYSHQSDKLPDPALLCASFEGRQEIKSIIYDRMIETSVRQVCSTGEWPHL